MNNMLGFENHWFERFKETEKFTYAGLHLLDILRLDTHLFLRECLNKNGIDNSKWKLKWLIKKLILNVYPCYFFENSMGRPGRKPDRLTSAEKGRRYILFIAESFTKSYLDTLVLIIERVLRDSIYDPFILCSNLRAQEILERKGLRYYSFKDFCDDAKHYKEQIQVYRKAFQAMRKALHQSSEEDAFLDSIVKYGFFDYLTIKLLVLIRYIDAVEKLLHQFNIKGIVTSIDTSPLEKTSVLLCKRKKLPSIVVQHGMTGMTPDSLMNLGYIPITSDVFCAAGRLHVRNLINAGADEEKIVVTGQPRFDLLGTRHKNIVDERTKERLVIPNGSFIALFASQTVFNNRSNASKITNMFTQAIRQINNLYIIVKLHPAESRSFYQNAFKKDKSARIIIVQDELDIYQLIKIVDVVMVAFSTVGLEALLCGKPLIQLNIHGRCNEMPYAAKKVAIPVDDAAELVQKILLLKKRNSDAFCDKDVIRRFINDFAFKSDGMACERITKIIYSCIENGPGHTIKEYRGTE